MRTLKTRIVWLCCTALLLSAGTALAQEKTAGYGLNAGDVLQVSVWREPELSRDVLVRPDGKINFPLVGDVQASGRTPEDVQAEIVERLDKFVPDAVATVAVMSTAGNKIYVLGKVMRPGEFTASKALDIMQALAMAGGLNQFAAGNKIKVLRRGTDGRQRAISFRYTDVEDGRDLQTNIILQSGDVVVVP